MEHKKRDVNVSGKVETDFSPQLIEKYETASGKEEGWKRKNFIVGVVTTGILILTVIFTASQSWLTRTSIINSRQQYQMDQRPYIWLASSTGPEGHAGQVLFRMPVEGQPIQIVIWYNNYGRSPAIVTGISTDAELGKNAIEKLHKVSWVKNDGIIPPNMVNAVVVDTTEKISPTNRSSVETSDGKGILNDAVALYLRIQYHDLGGHRYESDVCFSFQQGPAPLTYCPPELGLIKMIDCEREKCEDAN